MADQNGQGVFFTVLKNGFEGGLEHENKKNGCRKRKKTVDEQNENGNKTATKNGKQKRYMPIYVI